MFTDISKEVASDPWFKVVDCLQQNWAVIIERANDALVVFYGDGCGVFDEISYIDTRNAETALLLNGFNKYNSQPAQTHDVVPKPDGIFRYSPHPNGRIYSEGRFWVFNLPEFSFDDDSRHSQDDEISNKLSEIKEKDDEIRRLSGQLIMQKAKTSEAEFAIKLLRENLEKANRIFNKQNAEISELREKLRHVEADSEPVENKE